MKVKTESICVYICRFILDVLTDAPLTAQIVYEVVKEIYNFKQFCRNLCVAQRQTVMKTLQFYVEEPYFQATWKKLAMAIYQSHEDNAIDSLSDYMKSPPG